MSSPVAMTSSVDDLQERQKVAARPPQAVFAGNVREACGGQRGTVIRDDADTGHGDGLGLPLCKVRCRAKPAAIHDAPPLSTSAIGDSEWRGPSPPWPRRRRQVRYLDTQRHWSHEYRSRDRPTTANNERGDRGRRSTRSTETQEAKHLRDGAGERRDLKGPCDRFDAIWRWMADTRYQMSGTAR
jgi:hypothetical protein